MPLEQPAMMLIVPVGAIVVVVALRSGRPAGPPVQRESDHAGNGPRRSASSREAASDSASRKAATRPASASAGVGVVGDLERGERVGPAHDAQADLARGARRALDLGERVAVRVDHVVEEPRGGVDRPAQPVPVEIAAGHELAEIDAAERARFERQERLLAARVGGLDRAEPGRGLLGVDAIDEHHPRIADRPGGVRDRVEHAARVELAVDRAGARVDRDRRSRPRRPRP